MTYEKAMPYIDGTKIITNLALIPKIEPHFFSHTGFVPDMFIDVFPKSFRYIAFNRDKSMFYCSPSTLNPYFDIHRTNEIEKVEILTSCAGDGSLVGALLFGTVGAIVGSNNKKSRIALRIHLKNSQCPFYDFYILLQPLSPKDRYYIEALDIAKRIFGQLSSFIETIAPPSQDADINAIEKMRQYKSLMDDGIITHEEFEVKKKQLLNCSQPEFGEPQRQSGSFNSCRRQIGDASKK